MEKENVLTVEQYREKITLTADLFNVPVEVFESMMPQGLRQSEIFSRLSQITAVAQFLGKNFSQNSPEKFKNSALLEEQICRFSCFSHILSNIEVKVQRINFVMRQNIYDRLQELVNLNWSPSQDILTGNNEYLLVGSVLEKLAEENTTLLNISAQDVLNYDPYKDWISIIGYYQTHFDLFEQGKDIKRKISNQEDILRKLHLRSTLNGCFNEVYLLSASGISTNEIFSHVQKRLKTD